MDSTAIAQLLEFDRQHIIHPYSACPLAGQPYCPPLLIERAQGVYLYDANGRAYIDGMSSWWCAVHGYNHPHLNRAIERQLGNMAHVMFGGISHAPAIELSQQILALAPKNIDAVFFVDSGSVAMEAAMKLAIQYWHSQNKPQKQRFISLKHGYHGDTLGAMSISDPKNGMHQLFAEALLAQIHTTAPPQRHHPDHEAQLQTAIADLKTHLQNHGAQLAALVLEPLVQGAGGMRFYDARYLQAARALCDEYEVLLIADEIATGFGRIGSYFACDQAGIRADIIAIGKALTGGYLTLAACLLDAKINRAISAAPPFAFMHGPTFMANPLACSVALASLQLLAPILANDGAQIQNLARQIENLLAPCQELDGVANVRVCGAIGVVELCQAVDMVKIMPIIRQQNIWLRPFGKLVYIMPALTMREDELTALCQGLTQALRIYLAQNPQRCL